MDAPLALSATGLVLAGPDALEQREPALFESPEPLVDVQLPALPPSNNDPVVPPLAPEDDPLSPVGDPASGSRRTASFATTSCCGSCITYAVSVICTAGVDEALPAQAGNFRFSAAASCSAGAPSSITVSYNRTGSTAGSSDYSGPITSNSVTIPLTNGRGYKDVAYSVTQDVIDEVTEYVQVNIPRTAIINPPPPNTPNPPPITEWGPVYDNDIEWQAGDPIQATINAGVPQGETPTVVVYETLGLSIDATDLDRYKEDGVWHDYYDDVTSGDTADDYHIKWTASEGKFIQNGVETDTAYGIYATYLAPDYADGQLVRNVTITATVDDINRGDDVDGFDDNALQKNQAAEVVQVDVSVSQAGNVSLNYDGTPMDDFYGGGKLGWVTPNNPAGTTGYHGVTEIKGKIGGNGPPDGWDWHQQVKGTMEYVQNGNLVRPPGDNFANWADDTQGPNGIVPGGTYAYWDKDARAEVNYDGQDKRYIYVYDPPGFFAGGDNDAYIADSHWTEYRQNYQFQTWVERGGKRVSNIGTWTCSFSLKADANGKWAIVGPHTP